MTSVLVVDDDAVDRQLASRCLGSFESMEIRYAKDGEEALAEIARQRPDVVLTDLLMPRIDGLELVERVTAADPFLPVVLMTARGSEQVAVQALKAGAASYVAKSDLRRDLAETIEQVLEVQEARRSQVEVLSYLQRTESRFSLPNDPSLISPLVAYLQGGLERLAFGSETVRGHMGIALMEALSNAMIHGNLEVGSDLKRSNRDMYERMIAKRRVALPYARRVVICEVRETRDRIDYTIRDSGPGFDVASLPDPTDPENLLGVTGRGIMLMCTFMDEVTYNDKGNEVCLTKLRPAESATQEA